MATLQDRLAAMLTAKGYIEVKSSSRKYRQFKASNPEDRMFYFIGKMGALRRGPNVSSSHSICSNSARLLERNGF